MTAPVISVLATTTTTAKLVGTAATGVGPFTYQWYRSTTAGFTPGGGNILAGKTSLSLTDTGLTPNVAYYYKLVATDTGDSNTTQTSNQAAVVSEPQGLTENPNQFAQNAILGQPTDQVQPNTQNMQIDVSETATLRAGQAVKFIGTGKGGIPKVVACTADTDQVCGYINFNPQKNVYVAGDRVQVSGMLNVLFLSCSSAVARGGQVCLETDAYGSVKATTGSSGARIVGYALDVAAAGDTIPIFLLTPSFRLDA